MATKSGMNYGEVANLIQFINTKSTEIDNIMEDLMTNMPSRIAGAYSGEAAETYKNTLTKCSTSIQNTLQELLTSLQTATTEKQEAYTAQDKKMQESAEV